MASRAAACPASERPFFGPRFRLVFSYFSAFDKRTFGGTRPRFNRRQETIRLFSTRCLAQLEWQCSSGTRPKRHHLKSHQASAPLVRCGRCSSYLVARSVTQRDLACNGAHLSSFKQHRLWTACVQQEAPMRSTNRQIRHNLNHRPSSFSHHTKSL